MFWGRKEDEETHPNKSEQTIRKRNPTTEKRDQVPD